MAKTEKKRQRGKPVSPKESVREEVSASTSSAAKRPGDPSGGIIWAIFLIFLGTVFLLNTTGLLSWNIWGFLWRFWPLTLVFTGLRIVLGTTRFSGWITGGCAIVTLIVILALGYIVTADLGSTLPKWLQDFGGIVIDAGEQKTEFITINEDSFAEVHKRDVVIDVGASKFTLADEDQAYYLDVEGTYYQNFGKPIVETEEEDNELDIHVTQEQGKLFSLSSKTPEYILVLGQNDLETSVDIDIGAGSGEVAFDQTVINGFQADVGAGDLTISFGEASVPINVVKIDVGAGKAKLHIPGSVGFQIESSIGVGSVKIDGQDFSKIGADHEVYRSDNYESADETINIELTVGVGTFEITTVT